MASSSSAGRAEDKPAAKAAAEDKPAATIVIRLHRTLAGWGERDQVIEVEHTEQVDQMIANELAERVAKKDVTATAGGLLLTADAAAAADAG